MPNISGGEIRGGPPVRPKNVAARASRTCAPPEPFCTLSITLSPAVLDVLGGDVQVHPAHRHTQPQMTHLSTVASLARVFIFHFEYVVFKRYRLWRGTVSPDACKPIQILQANDVTSTPIHLA